MHGLRWGVYLTPGVVALECATQTQPGISMNDLALVAGSAGVDLAKGVGSELRITPTDSHTEIYPDGEVDVSVDPSIREGDVYVIQSLSPPVNEHLVELLMLADACRGGGAARITAVVPYLAYARNDRRTRPGEAVGLAVVRDVIEASPIDRLVVVDPHISQVAAVFDLPVDVVSAVPALSPDIDVPRPEATMVVSPDLGAVALAERHAEALGLSDVGVIRKTRLSGDRVEATGLVGESKRPDHVIVADDIISTGATIEAAVDAIRERWSPGRIAVVATHALMVDGAAERLEGLGIDHLVVSDSVPAPPLPDGGRVVGLASLVASTIRDLHGAEGG